MVSRRSSFQSSKNIQQFSRSCSHVHPPSGRKRVPIQFMVTVRLFPTAHAPIYIAFIRPTIEKLSDRHTKNQTPYARRPLITSPIAGAGLVAGVSSDSGSSIEPPTMNSANPITPTPKALPRDPSAKRTGLIRPSADHPMIANPTRIKNSCCH